MPRSYSSQLSDWVNKAKRNWADWSLDKQRDFLKLGLVSREELEASTDKERGLLSKNAENQHNDARLSSDEDVAIEDIQQSSPRKRKKGNGSAQSPPGQHRRNTSEDGLEEYRRRAFGGTDEEYASISNFDLNIL